MKVIILRGLPGAGKSTVAKQYEDAVICSADHFFIKDGRYQFDGKKLPEAHASCRNAFENAIFRKCPTIIVDNTNVIKNHFQFYIDFAKNFGYEVEIKSIFDGGLDDESLSKRNVHGVPVASIKRMRENWEE